MMGCYSFNHIVEFNHMKEREREGRERLVDLMKKRNDCFVCV